MERSLQQEKEKEKEKERESAAGGASSSVHDLSNSETASVTSMSSSHRAIDRRGDRTHRGPARGSLPSRTSRAASIISQKEAKLDEVKEALILETMHSFKVMELPVAPPILPEEAEEYEAEKETTKDGTVPLTREEEENALRAAIIAKEQDELLRGQIQERLGYNQWNSQLQQIEQSLQGAMKSAEYHPTGQSERIRAMELYFRSPLTPKK